MQPEYITDGKLANDRGEVGLVDLLTLMCFVLPFAGAMGFSKAGYCGSKGVVLAVLIGVPLGLVFAASLHQGIGFLVTRFSDSKSRFLTVVYLLAMISWMGLSGWTGGFAEETFFPKQSAYLRACRTSHSCLTLQAKQDLENIH